MEGGIFSTKAAYTLFQPLGPKVGWSSLLLGPLKISHNIFILWLAILGRLSTMDKHWLSHLDGRCSLCNGGQLENHSHMFFNFGIHTSALQLSEDEFNSLGRTVIRSLAFFGRQGDGEVAM
ncbi:hypothetical protein Sango_1899400 [Sesamum angolense]|uniref:Reverse transcriptase zinc-binding domain-containing protein n=1 Tax=Sesamum angolense TaxID=2727404 RepID=A0AAE1WJ50_9LAMI|nr:hypothetical protein Sango_1899400 [Sesamum angolense]